jgi:hypothetical protein
MRRAPKANSTNGIAVSGPPTISREYKPTLPFVITPVPLSSHQIR